MNFEQAVKQIKPLDESAKEQAALRQGTLVKPLGSLGTLEDISIQMAGITGNVKNKITKKISFLFGADNGVYEQGIASSPQNFTNLLMTYYGEKRKCAINVICEHNNVDLKIIDIGVIGTLDYSNIDNKRLMEGTNDFSNQPAMTRETVQKAIEIGFSYAVYAKENNYDIIGNGEVGIGNTTTAAACIMASLGIEDTSAVGRGAGLSEEAFKRKQNVVLEALRLHTPDKNDPIDILSKVGGLDIAAMVGLYVGAAYYRIPIVIDGVISISAALLAYTLNPIAKDFMIPSHLSEEPGYKLAASKMNLTPILNLGMRLGEGTGCPIAMGIVENALAVMSNMNTFAEVDMETSTLEKYPEK